MLNKKSVFYLLLALIIFLPFDTWGKNDKSVQASEINRFYDALMQLASYDKYRDFYDSYIEEIDIPYDRFVQEIKQRKIVLSGGYDSKLIGWQRKGKRIVITIDSSIHGNNKRVQLMLIEKKDGLKISSTEFFNKICEKKRVARRKK